MRKNFEDPTNITSNFTGVVAFLDLDQFKKCSMKMGWTRYSPNCCTEFMTRAVKELIYKKQVLHLWGLNEKEGTEEAILIFQSELERILKRLDHIRVQFQDLAIKNGAPTSLSIGLATGKIYQIKHLIYHSKKEFRKDPTVYLAYKALREAKKRGGNRIISY